MNIVQPVIGTSGSQAVATSVEYVYCSNARDIRHSFTRLPHKGRAYHDDDGW